MKIAIIGAGRIGRGIARQLAASHELMLSFSRHPEALEKLTGSIGTTVAAGAPAQAAGFGEVVVVSVPWGMIPLALQDAGPLDGKIVIDTTNQFGPPPLPPRGRPPRTSTPPGCPGHVMPSRSTPSPPPSRPRPRAAPVRRGWCSGCAATTPGPRRWSPA